MTTPWMTSDQIIEAVKRKISFPTSQSTFTDDDILKFANEEMFIAQVPSVLMYHEEYFVTYENVDLVANKLRYSIPNRAIGMRLRDVFYKDTNNNLYEMTRINPEDKAWFQRDFNSFNQPYPYYLEGNELVLPSNSMPNPTGSLQFSFYIRPNQLVSDDNAAIITGFCETVTIDNSSIVNLDTVTITIDSVSTVFTAITGGTPVGTEFLVGASASLTAINLAASITSSGITTATSTGAIVHIDFDTVNFTVETNNTSAFDIPDTTCVTFSSIPSNIISGSVIDFLQTLPGHRILGYDVTIPSGGVSGTDILFDSEDIPDGLIIGDYVCLQNTAIIPQIPPDLHNLLAERTSARILAAIGDLEGLQITNQKIQEMEKNQGRLLDSRVDGSPVKVNNRHSLLHSGTRKVYRRF